MLYLKDAGKYLAVLLLMVWRCGLLDLVWVGGRVNDFPSNSNTARVHNSSTDDLPNIQVIHIKIDVMWFIECSIVLEYTEL
jgi:hypothetical protein